MRIASTYALNFLEKHKKLILTAFLFVYGCFLLFYVIKVTVSHNYSFTLIDNFLERKDKIPLIPIFLIFSLALIIFRKKINLGLQELKKIKIKHFILIYLTLFTAFFTFAAYYKHINLQTTIFDFAVEKQVIFNTANGDYMGSGVEKSNYTAIHFAPMLILPALIYKIFPSALTLFIIQTLFVAIAAFGIYKLSFLFFKHKWFSYLWMITFSLHFGISGLLVFDFHEVALAMPFLVWGIYFFVSSARILWTYLMFLIASLFKEDVNLFIIMLSFYWLIWERKLKAAPILVYGVIMSYLTFFKIIPNARGSESSQLIERYSQLGNSPGEIIKTIIIKPSKLYEQIVSFQRFSYMFKLFFPVSFLFIFAPVAFLVIIPSLLLNLLNGGRNGTLGSTGILHYEVMIVVGIFYASILGCRNLINFLDGYFQKKNIIKLISAIFIMINLFFLVGHPVWQYIFGVKNRISDYQYLQEIKKKIPDNAIVSASNSAGGQFGDRARNKLQIFDPPWISYKEKPDFIIVDKVYNYDDNIQARIKELSKVEKYEVMDENKSFVILRKQ